MSDKSVMIAEYYSEIEAEMARSRLESVGIQSWILKDDAGGMQPQLQMSQGVRLFVNQGDVDEALGILDWEDELEDDEEEGETEDD